MTVSLSPQWTLSVLASPAPLEIATIVPAVVAVTAVGSLGVASLLVGLRVAVVPLFERAFGVDPPTPPIAFLTRSGPPLTDPDRSRRSQARTVLAGLCLATVVFGAPVVAASIVDGTSFWRVAAVWTGVTAGLIAALRWLVRGSPAYGPRERAAYTAFLVLAVLTVFLETTAVWDWPGFEFTSVAAQVTYASGTSLWAGPVGALFGAALARTGRQTVARAWLVAVGGSALAVGGLARRHHVAGLPVDAVPESVALGFTPYQIASIVYVGGLYAAVAALAVAWPAHVLARQRRNPAADGTATGHEE